MSPKPRLASGTLKMRHREVEQFPQFTQEVRSWSRTLTFNHKAGSEPYSWCLLVEVSEKAMSFAKATFGVHSNSEVLEKGLLL